MNESLFDNRVGLSQNRGQSETSESSAGGIASVSGAKRRAVYQAIVASGDDGMTDEEMQDATGMAPNTQRPRRVELVRDGSVIDSGIRRNTKSGRKAVVWTRPQS